VTSLQNPSGIFGTVCLSTTWNLWKERKKECSEESEPHGIAATENSNGDAAAEQILSMTIGKHSPHCRRNVAVQFTAMLAILFTLQFNCNLNTESLSTEIITELTKQLPATSKKIRLTQIESCYLLPQTMLRCSLTFVEKAIILLLFRRFTKISFFFLDLLLYERCRSKLLH
jgi:hypothetical protein